MTCTKQKAKNEEIKTVELKVLQLFTSRSMPLAFTISLAILIFIAGCSPVKSGPVEPGRIEPHAVEPNVVEPNVVEPNVVEPNVVEPNVVEPNVIEPNVVEPNVIEPNVIEPNVVEPNVIEPNVIEPNEVEPNELKPQPKVSFHDKCADILSNFVNDKGMVGYQKLVRERLELKTVLDEFTRLDRNEYSRWPKEDKIAFWINAYNMQMLSIIVQNYPIESQRWDRLWWPPTSIRHLNKRIGGIGKQKFYVMDEEFTLAEIEKRFFRKEFDEPRIFFAISHASLSSPLLRNEPYYGYKLDEQLDDQAKKFLSSPSAFKIDREEQKVYLSALLQSSWYGNEFISKYGTDKKFKDQQPTTQAVLNFITNYVSKREILFLERQIYSVRHIKYDWRINDSSER